MMPVLEAVDSETTLILPGLSAPHPACFTFATGDDVSIEHGDDAYALVRRGLEHRHTTWANAPFDLGVIGQRWPDLIPLIFKALDEDRISDVQSREKLLDIAKGRFRFHEDPETEEVVPVKYTLGDIAQRRRVGRKMFDEWRLHYYKLVHKALDEWPADAKTYACVDAIITLAVHRSQDEEVAQNEMLRDTLASEFEAVRGHWALHLITAWGFPTDGEAVDKLHARCVHERDAMYQDLVDAGLVREDGTRDVKAVKVRVLQAFGQDEVPITATGLERMKGIGKDGEKTTPITRYRAIEAGYISTSKETCWESGDELLSKYARYSQLANLLSKDLPRLHEGTVLPVQAGYQPIMETFRTSSVGFNIQNLRREPGVRECFKARDGYVIVACDFDTAELVSLAQVTYTLFGASDMRDVINAGLDIHLKVAGELTNKTYEEAKVLKRAGDEEIDVARQLAKACYHPDTEVLTRKGWVPIDELYVGEAVAAAIPQVGGGVALEWQVPTDVFRQANPHDHLIHYRNEGIDIRVTPDHRMLYWNGKGNPRVREARDFTGNERKWANAGAMEGSVVEDLDVLRLVAAVQADGSYSGRQIKLGFSKERKIERMRALLDRLGADYDVKDYSNGQVEKPTTYFTIRRGDLVERVKSWLDEKQFSWQMLDLTLPCREALVEETEFWDGHRIRRAFRYSSSGRQNVDVLQALAASVGRKTRLVVAEDGCWGLTIRHKHDTRGENTERTIEPYAGDVVCLTVPSGFVLVRDGGVPLICGNCNFGFPGGMGPNRFSGYAAGYLKKYKRTVSISDAAILKQKWMGWFREMPHYFDWIKSHSDEDGFFWIQHPITKRWRGKTFFTAASNNGFQELTAFGAKAAAYAVARAQHAEPHSPLYGTKSLAFVHDELLVEMPWDRYLGQRCAELERVMCAAYNRYTPDVPVSAESKAMLRWSKNAKRVTDEHGLVTVYQPKERAS